MKIDLYIRQAEVDDIPFIKNSWLKSYRDTMKHMDQSLYKKNQDRLMCQILASSQCLVACSPDEHKQIYGWIIFETINNIAILHYVYVKMIYRKYKIASELFRMIERDKSIPVIASHFTRRFHDVKKPWNLTYNPYILLGKYGSQT